MNENEINAMMQMSDNDFLAWLPDPLESTPAESVIISDEIERRFPGARAEFHRRMAARINDFAKSIICERPSGFDLPSLFSDEAPEPAPVPDHPSKPPLRPAMAADDVRMGVQYDQGMAGS